MIDRCCPNYDGDEDCDKCCVYGYIYSCAGCEGRTYQEFMDDDEGRDSDIPLQRLCQRVKEPAGGGNMYEELIKILYKLSENHEYDPFYPSNELRKAADAIEDLRRQLAKSEADNINLTGWLAEEHAKHLWIPVTERLPEKPENYPFCELRQCFFLVTLASTAVVSCGFDFDNNRWREIIPVTHWMPLPEPPKEENP